MQDMLRSGEKEPSAGPSAQGETTPLAGPPMPPAVVTVAADNADHSSLEANSAGQPGTPTIPTSVEDPQQVVSGDGTQTVKESTAKDNRKKWIDLFSAN